MTELRVTKAVGGYGSAENILKGISIHVSDQEIVTIVGPNGAGKSTLLKTIAGLIPLKDGTIEFADRDVSKMDALGRAACGIGFVPQEKNVFSTLSIHENLSTSAFSMSKAEARRLLDEVYSRYPMLRNRRGVLARTLSGGQRQILAMAMGLMGKPSVMLLDEPTAGLSPKAAEELFAAIVTLNQTGLPILIVEQHAIESLSISHRGYVLVSGQVAATGTGNDLSNDREIRRVFLGV